MGFLVGKFMLLFCGSEGSSVFLEVCLRKKDAAAVGALIVVVTVCFGHVFRLVDV
jgi:hypothetical protein